MQHSRDGNDASQRPASDASDPSPPGRRTMTQAIVGRGADAPAAEPAPEDRNSYLIAHEGVAGGGQAYPFRDQIEASFGRPIQARAHVGGEAASAAGALGAQAYAFGGDVAFAAPPDLHLSAHEAAHTLQQADGVQRKSAVDEPGDAYEAHADLAADLVVRGQSAAHLFGGAQASTGPVIQRKKLAAPTEPQTTQAGGQAEVVRTSLLAAQHWLDKAAESRKKDVVEKAINEVIPLFTTIIGVLEDPEEVKQLDRTRIVRQMDETSRALAAMRAVAGDADPTGIRILDGQEQWVRTTLGMSSAPKPGKHLSAAKPDGAYESMALDAVLDLVTIEANRAYKRLELDSPTNRVDRAAIVDHAVTKIVPLVDAARDMIVAQPGQDAADRFGAKIEVMSLAILRIRAWIASRQDARSVSARFDVAMGRTDELRALVGFGKVMELPAPTLSQQETEEAGQEKEDLHEAEKNLHRAIASAFTGLELGADEFFEKSKLPRIPEPPSVWEELAKGVLIAMVGNLAGPLVGATINALRTKAVSEAALGLINGIATDSIQSIGGTVVQEAVASSGSQNQQIRDAFAIKTCIIKAQGAFDDAFAEKLHGLVAARNISKTQLDAMTIDAKATAKEIQRLTFQKASSAFAEMLSGRQLRSKGEAVSAMDDHAGKKALYGGTIPGSGKVGMVGVAHLNVEINPLVPFPVIRGFELNGISDDLARGVLENAGYSIAALDLPLEIHVDMRNTSLHDHYAGKPLLAVDERGELRSSGNWPDGHPPGVAPSREWANKWYSTPGGVWEKLRTQTIPRDTVKLT